MQDIMLQELEIIHIQAALQYVVNSHFIEGGIEIQRADFQLLRTRRIRMRSRTPSGYVTCSSKVREHAVIESDGTRSTHWPYFITLVELAVTFA